MQFNHGLATVGPVQDLTQLPYPVNPVLEWALSVSLADSTKKYVRIEELLISRSRTAHAAYELFGFPGAG